MSADRCFDWTIEETADAYALWVELPSPDVRWALQGRRLKLTSYGQTCHFALPADTDLAHVRVETAARQARIHLPRVAHQKSA